MSLFSQKMPSIFTREWYGININVVIEKNKITLSDNVANDIHLYDRFNVLDFHGGISFITVINENQVHKISMIPYQAKNNMEFRKLLIVGEVDIGKDAWKRFVDVLVDIKKDKIKTDVVYYYNLNELLKVIFKNQEMISNIIYNKKINIEKNIEEMLSLQLSILAVWSIAFSNIIHDKKKKEFISSMIITSTKAFDIGYYISDSIAFIISSTKEANTVNDVIISLTLFLNAKLNTVAQKDDYYRMSLITDNVLKYLGYF